MVGQVSGLSSFMVLCRGVLQPPVSVKCDSPMEGWEKIAFMETRSIHPNANAIVYSKPVTVSERMLRLPMATLI